MHFDKVHSLLLKTVIRVIYYYRHIIQKVNYTHFFTSTCCQVYLKFSTEFFYETYMQTICSSKTIKETGNNVSN